jgi:hypothetical protein
MDCMKAVAFAIASRAWVGSGRSSATSAVAPRHASNASVAHGVVRVTNIASRVTPVLPRFKVLIGTCSLREALNNSWNHEWTRMNTNKIKPLRLIIRNTMTQVRAFSAKTSNTPHPVPLPSSDEGRGCPQGG